MNVLKYVVLLICILLLLPFTAFGQEGDSQEVLGWAERIASSVPSQQEPEPEFSEQVQVDNTPYVLNAKFRLLQERNRLWLLVALVGSTPILVALVLFFMKNNPNCSSEHLVTAVGLILVVEGTMFICVSAETHEELTAPIGILGAIAGYLFGSAKKRSEENVSGEKKAVASG